MHVGPLKLTNVIKKFVFGVFVGLRVQKNIPRNFNVLHSFIITFCWERQNSTSLPRCEEKIVKTHNITRISFKAISHGRWARMDT